jgi:iron(III) transport system substrate-binding protein
MRAIHFATLLCAALVAAGTVTPVSSADNEVVVYSARHYGQEAAFDAFTKKTGIQIKVFNGSTGELFERLKAEGDKTQADVLLSVKPSELSTYEALGDPKWKNRICLRTSGYIYNQSLLATMIRRHGEPRVEEIVKGWVANSPILINGDTKILEAIAAGQCDVGVVNHYYLARIVQKTPDFPVSMFWANQQTTGTHVNISGAGVTTHARRRANAIRFIEFLSGPEAQQLFADVALEFPASPQAGVNPVVAKWGKFKADEINIAAAGEHQAAATRLADRAGYK